MGSQKLLLMFIILLALVLSLNAMQNVQQQGEEDEISYEVIEEDIDDNDHATSEIDQSSTSSADREGRYLLQRKRTRRMTCNKFPRVCRAKGSPGPYCCKKKCVDVMRDRMNCGMCGKKCKYNEVCCKGKCVNPAFNRNHCGGCNNRCKNGSLCVLGLCDYA